MRSLVAPKTVQKRRSLNTELSLSCFPQNIIFSRTLSAVYNVCLELDYLFGMQFGFNIRNFSERDLVHPFYFAIKTEITHCLCSDLKSAVM